MNMYPIIKGITLDMEALMSISHGCKPELCKSSICCCASYEVCIDNQELLRIIGFLPIASMYSSHLKSNTGFENVFEEVDSNLCAIDTNEEGLCSLAYFGNKGEVLCSLHSTALYLDFPPAQIKPKSCLLWPLALTENRPLTLSIHEDAFSFPCNNATSGGYSGLDKGIADIIKKVFGSKFLEEVKKAAKIPQ